MKIYAPKYYSDFTCIADRCKHSCCVGWEIDVDEKTLQKYALLGTKKGEKVRESIEYGDTPHFKLAEGDRCPHLDGRGLCKIILGLGEDYLCDICREHPRFYNYTSLGKEVGLGMACEEACRLILASDAYADMVEIGSNCDEQYEADFDAVRCREVVYKILSDRSVEYSERLNAIHKKYKVKPTVLDDDEWQQLFERLEYLNAEDKKLFSVYSSDAKAERGRERQLERALAYFIYRHCSETETEGDFCAALGFCLVCERLLASMCDNFKSIQITELARILSEEIEYSEENTEAIKNAFI